MLVVDRPQSPSRTSSFVFAPARREYNSNPSRTKTETLCPTDLKSCTVAFRWHINATAEAGNVTRKPLVLRNLRQAVITALRTRQKQEQLRVAVGPGNAQFISIRHVSFHAAARHVWDCCSVVWSAAAAAAAADDTALSNLLIKN